MAIQAVTAQGARIIGKRVLKKTAQKVASKQTSSVINARRSKLKLPTSHYNHSTSQIKNIRRSRSRPQATTVRHMVKNAQTVTNHTTIQKPKKLAANIKEKTSSKKNLKRIKLMVRMRFLIPFFIIHSVINFLLLVVIGLSFLLDKIPFGLGEAAASLSLSAVYAISISITIIVIVWSLLLASASSIKPLRHKNSLLIVLVFTLYMMPGVNLAPWIMLWAWKITAPE